MINKYLNQVRNVFISTNELKKLRDTKQKIWHDNDINICYNKFIQKNYDYKKKNILIAIESPEVIEYEKWIDPDMNFIAEISFMNYFNLDNYHCPVDIYSTNDNYVNMSDYDLTFQKSRLISLIYSQKKKLSGHILRHEIANKFKNEIDLFGSGTGRFLTNKIESLSNYMFHVVIENGQYPNYVSEKFFDCIKTLTIPIYRGGQEAVEKMGFDHRGVIYFNKITELEDVINNISEDAYNKIVQYAYYNRNRLIEIRNTSKLKLVLSSVGLGYFHTTMSYFSVNNTTLNLNFE